MQDKQAQLDFIIPAFNEEQTIELTYQRLTKIAENLRLFCNFIFIDDGSSDDTWSILSRLAENDKRIKALRFSRNFGHQAAITAGIEHSQADYSLIIDADLQDPPELAEEMLELAKAGYDIVYGIRTSRKGESFTKKFTAEIFYRTINLFLDFEMPRNVGDFRLVSARARQLFLNVPDKSRLNREIWSSIGLAQTGIEYERPARIAGESKYNFKRMLRLAFDGITSAGSKPLRPIIITACLLIIVSIALLFTTPILSAITFCGAILLIALWLTGIYIAKTYRNITNRPPYYTIYDTSHT